MPPSNQEQLINETDEESKLFLGKAVAKLSKFASKEEPSLGTRSHKHVSKKAPATVVDDRFFKLSEMEEFLENEEREKPAASDTDDEDGIDLFEEISDDDDDAANVMFKDFFDGPDDQSKDGGEKEGDDEDLEDEDGIDTRDVDDTSTSGNVDVLSKLMEASDSEDESRHKEKSSYEKEQELEAAKMRKLEMQNLESKPWQLQGEASATARPLNSLLEEYLPFDAVSRDPPPVTVDTSKKLEEILKLRISNASWDDVERKVKPDKEPFEFRRRIELEQNKSKLSLAQVYEKEFNDKRKDEPFVQEKTAAQIEVEQMSRAVLLKLSALSSFHFTPRLPEPSVQMINNLPAITVEEAIPEATSTVTLVAPQEIAAPEKRVTKGKTEREETDKNRERRFKKKFQANKFKLQSLKSKKSDSKKPLQQPSGQASVKSSKFFSELQRKVTDANATKLGPKKSLVNIKQLKL